MSGLADEGARVVLCGDLNSAPELGEIPAERYGFVDATAPQHDLPDYWRRRPTVFGAEYQRPLSWDGKRNPLVSQGWFTPSGGDAQTQLDYVFTSAERCLRRPAT